MLLGRSKLDEPLRLLTSNMKLSGVTECNATNLSRNPEHPMQMRIVLAQNKGLQTGIHGELLELLLFERWIITKVILGWEEGLPA